VTYTDNGLKLNTTYQYRVFAVQGSRTSDASSVFTAATQVAGSGGTVDVTQDITANTTWTNDKTYTLKGFIHVGNGATLTIQPGTKIMGDFNTLGSSLFILRGAKINAVGTADAPIVFTSSRAVGQRQPGDWGGLIIIGNARINRSGTVQVEGTGTVTGSTSGTNYPVNYSGGSADDDNSGTLSYVRVEFAGFVPRPHLNVSSAKLVVHVETDSAPITLYGPNGETLVSSPAGPAGLRVLDVTGVVRDWNAQGSAPRLFKLRATPTTRNGVGKNTTIRALEFAGTDSDPRLEVQY
jgi:hypothetical protein